MKYTKILAFLVCFAVICSLSQLASCNSDNKGDENAATTTTAANDETTTVAPDVEDEVTTADKNADEDTTKVPEDTDNGNAPTYPADSMSSAECFDFAAEEFFSAFENLKNAK